LRNFIKQTVRNLRKNQTEAEKILWSQLRNRKLNNQKFLRQHPIFFEINGQKRFFVADFYCSKKRLVIEVDGKIHLRQKDYDEIRTEIINFLGIKVIRFQNEEIQNNLTGVIEQIQQHL